MNNRTLSNLRVFQKDTAPLVLRNPCKNKAVCRCSGPLSLAWAGCGSGRRNSQNHDAFKASVLRLKESHNNSGSSGTWAGRVVLAFPA